MRHAEMVNDPNIIYIYILYPPGPFKGVPPGCGGPLLALRLPLQPSVLS
jgi:hypothetical protein